MARTPALLLLALCAKAAATDVPLATFDGAAATTHTWKEMNDPVMGGKSTGTFSISGGVGVFDGEVAGVPSLKAPGFIKTNVVDSKPFGHIFPDISTCEAIALEVKASSPYTGFRFSIGIGHAPGGKFFAFGYKADFAAPVEEFGVVIIPLNQFTDYWDDATGKAVKTCQDDKIYCPDSKTLKDMRTMSVWAEGVKGKVHLEIKSIAATGCGKSDVAATIMHV